MRYALSLPNMGSARRLVEVAALADANGWDAVFVWDHVHFFRRLGLDVHDPWVLLGAMATVTETVRLGAMVTPLPRRRPQKLAKEVVTLDHLSAGRTVVGVGIGFPPEDEYAMFGESVDARERADRLDEALDVVTALWADGSIDHRGRWYRLSAELAPVTVQRPRPPIWVAAQWPNRRPLARARRYDGVIPIGPDGGLLGLAELRQVADAVGPERDVVASWLPGVAVAEHEAAGATWLVESRWPVDGWVDELAALAAQHPRAGRP